MSTCDHLDLLLEKYTTHLRNERRLADNSVITYRNMLAQYAAFAKAGGVESFLSPQSEELQKFLEGLRDKRNPDRRLKPRTLSLHVSVLHLFYRWLALNEHLGQAGIRPVLNLERPKIDRTLLPVLSREQMMKLLNAPQKGSNCGLYRAMLETLYSTACRESELVNMRLENLDLRAASIRTTAKGGYDRVFYLTRYAVGAIMLYLTGTRPRLSRKNHDSPWLFLASRGSGNRMRRDTVYAIVRRFCQQIGVEGNVGPHTIRRSAAVHLLMNGADLRSIMEYLGHQSVNATQVYLQLDPTHVMQAHASFHPHGANGHPPGCGETGLRQLADSAQWPETLARQAEDMIATAAKQQN